MPPGDTDVTMKQEPRGPASPLEQAFAEMGLAQGYMALDAQGRAMQDPRLRAGVIEDLLTQRTGEIQETQRLIAEAEQQLGSGEAFWHGGDAVVKERRDAAQQKLASLQSSLSELKAEKQFLPERLKEVAQTQEVSNLAAGRLRDFLSGKDLGVSPEERALITQGISGISQDVATSRGLNRSDTPVMQAIAPSISQALLAQANANRSLFTGINQFQQGMNLSERQLQAGLAGQNPAAGLSGVYAGLRPQTQDQSGSRGLGGADVMSMFGQGAMGAGLGLYGLGAAGLLGGGAGVGGLSALTYGGGTAGAGAGAAGTYGGSMAMGCWIAEAIYGTNAPETGVIRWWLNIHFAKQSIGRVVMALYRKYGRGIAGYVRRWTWLRQVLRPIFDLALQRGLATG